MNRVNGFITKISSVVQASRARATVLKIDTGLFHAEYVPKSETTYEDIVWHIWRKDGTDGHYFKYTMRGDIYPDQLAELKDILTSAEMTLFLEFEPYFSVFRTLLSWDRTLENTIKALADSAIGY